MDDPRQILSEAGVDVPAELVDYERRAPKHTLSSSSSIYYPGKAAILALARLVAEFKGRCDSVYDEGHQTGYQKGTLDAEGKYEPLIAKYKWQRDQSVADHCETGERPAEGVDSCDFCTAAIGDLDRRWEERDEGQ